MIDRLRRRIAVGERQGGFTLIELLVVIVIIGILLAIAVPSYLGFRDRANRAAAQSNVRSAIPAMEAFYSDNSTYVGATPAVLRANYDSGLSASIVTGGLAAAAYCISSDVGGQIYRVVGPGGTIVAGAAC